MEANWAEHPLYVKFRDNVESIGGRFIVALIIVAAGFLLARILSRWAASAVQRRPRGETLAPLSRAIVRVVVAAAAVVMALDQLGVPIATVIAGAGVVGIAIGFGAQALVKDVISGFFHIVEGVLSVGDVVQIGEVTGVVEEVGLRVTQVRTFNGQLWYLPNGTIDRVGNANRGWSRAIVEVPLAQENDLRHALGILQKLGDEYHAQHPDLVLEPPAAEGSLTLEPSAAGLRLVVKVKAQEHWAVERELRVRVKEAFDREGLEIPYPRRVVVQRTAPEREKE